jgi:hypothetical protein
VVRTFVFNVCANAVTPDACAATAGDLGEELSGPSPAYEVFSSDVARGGGASGKYGGDPSAHCMRLGDSVFDPAGADLTLMDAQNPAKGVRAAAELRRSLAARTPPSTFGHSQAQRYHLFLS